MRILIKLGGTLLDQAEGRTAIAAQLAEVCREHELVVVHGGGKQVTRFLAERGIESRFVNGLRVSDAAVMDAVIKNVAGTVNKELVAAIIGAGESATGLSGVDGPLTVAEPLNPELGWVGKPLRTEGRLLDLLVNSGYLPVIACIAGDRQGNIYNVNADQMAVSCAIGWSAERLLFLTDVSGVHGAAGHVIPALNVPAVRHLIESRVATGGMQAKLEAALAALSGGIADVTIAFGREPNVCKRLLSGELLGTRVAAES